ncbi:hypothetical protein GCM10025882_18100 [Acinetobacter gyllenbergii]|uniref:Arsenical resistance protein ArsH n=1 Tax=Acinetobacter gyllenbergii CIP 110306 = MTCC 11365 TaxID=1217657 RepID=A0A829HBI0_9GAMM|nr:arsenical resistance protein ArsH [Acinetobacter gyllenbergii CIP 110306 = MTCC 11365]GMA11385.1 hypothetical protein GCM10025882_18100 [Acinetobacter gyllenbergii]
MIVSYRIVSYRIVSYRIVDVMKELYKFTLLTRGQSQYLTDRYSERKKSTEELTNRVNQRNL